MIDRLILWWINRYPEESQNPFVFLGEMHQTLLAPKTFTKFHGNSFKS